MKNLMIRPNYVEKAYRKMVYAILFLTSVSILLSITPDEIPDFIEISIYFSSYCFVLYTTIYNFKIIYKWIEYRNAFVNIADEMKALGFIYNDTEIEEFYNSQYIIHVRFDHLNKYKVFYNGGTQKICISNHNDLLNTIKTLINSIKN